jgi:hypothetical protein
MTTTQAHDTKTTTTRAPFSYQATLEDALKVQWRVEDVLSPNERFDFGKPFLPDALVHAEQLAGLSASEKLTLNHIRAKTYLYLFGFVEEFILPFVLDQTRASVHGDNLRTRALVTFAEEEAKHIDLFKRFEKEFDSSFKTKIAVIGPADAVAKQVLDHSPLGVALVILHLEWLTQAHYIESVKTSTLIDTRFASLLKHHWQEEAQHAKLDTLLIGELAARATPTQIATAFDDYLHIAGILDGGLGAQVDLDVDALERHSGRKLSPAERADLVQAQVRSYRRTFLVSGARHPAFVETLRSLSADGAKRVEAAATALAA